MILKPITDKSEIRKIICDGEIYPRIAGKNAPLAKDFDFNGAVGEYLAGYVDGIIIALMVFEKLDYWTCHFQVLKEYRKKHADEFAIKSLEWFWLNHDTDLLTAKIENIHGNVLSFAYKHGFTGVNDGAFTKLELRR